MVVLGVLYANLLLLCNMPFSYIMYHDELCVCFSLHNNNFGFTFNRETEMMMKSMRPIILKWAAPTQQEKLEQLLSIISLKG